MSRAPKVKRQDREEPNIPAPSADVVESVMEAGGIGKAQRKAVEDRLATLREQYLRDWRNLGYYATDAQLDKGLTKVKKRAALLKSALEGQAVRYALQTTLILTVPGDNISEREQSEKICAGLDNDIAAVSRLHEVASIALKIQDNDSSQTPEFYANPSAQKPENIDLAWNIQRLWVELGRSEKGRDAPALANFAGRILEYILQRREIDPDTVADLLARARTARGDGRFVR